MTVPHSAVFQHIQAVVRASERYLLHIALPGPAIKILYHDDYDLPCCIFKGPDILTIGIGKAIKVHRSTLQESLLDCIASCAIHREFLLALEAYRISLFAGRTPKPYLHDYKSAKWSYYRLKLNDLTI